MQTMKAVVENYSRSKHLMFFTSVAIIFILTLFSTVNLWGAANESKESQKISNTDKQKQQTPKSSKNLQKADVCVNVGVIPDKRLAPSPDYAELDPFGEMRLMQERMDRLFDSTFSRFRMSPGFVVKDGGFPFIPKMDISEDKNNYIIRIDLPGMEKSDIKITFKGKNMIVSGKKERVKESKDNKGISYERSYGQFSRICSLPGPFDKSKTKAKYSKGVLNVTVAKAPEKKEKEVTVKVD
jgi:HSP20 family protein